MAFSLFRTSTPSSDNRAPSPPAKGSKEDQSPRRGRRLQPIDTNENAVTDLSHHLDSSLHLPPSSPEKEDKDNRGLKDRNPFRGEKVMTTSLSAKLNAPSRLSNITHKPADPYTGLRPDQIDKLKSPEVKRMATVSQLYFYDHYFDLLTYLHNRSQRTDAIKETNKHQGPGEFQKTWKQYSGRERAALRKRRAKLRTNDFHVLAQVGQGGYGQVYLAHKNDTREICALKVMSKRVLFKMDEIRHVLTERDILTAAKSPWLVKLLYAFQDEQSIYLAMEYVPGGDFRTLLNNTGTLSSAHARFYISEMFSSVDALHKLGYIHRDLKPENFLIDSTGHIKLTDFGLSSGLLSPSRIDSMKNKLNEVKDVKVTLRPAAERRALYKSLRERNPELAKSVVGSPDYMAPEVLKGKEYNFTVDYWSLGCMLFEAYVGYPPFAGGTPEETWSNLRHWKEVFKRPYFDNQQYTLSDRTWDFMTR